MNHEATKASAAEPYPISSMRAVFDVDAIDDIAGYIRVHGKEVAVHHLDAASYRAIQQLGNGPAAVDLFNAYDAVARCCPELTRDEVDRLTPPKIGVILGVAQLGIRAVEAQDPNAGGPTETTDASPESPPA